MAGRLAQYRSVLLLEVQALVQAGVLPSAVTAELVGGTSYGGLALDVLPSVFRLATPPPAAPLNPKDS